MALDSDIARISEEAFAVLGTGRQVPPFCERFAGFALQDAYRVTAAVSAARRRRGELPVGRKIGFTNRVVWERLGYEPMWGFLYDRTVHDLGDGAGGFSLAGFSEPRIEPEIVFRFASPPRPGMDEGDLLDCLDWVAPGFEIVQSIFPGWKFTDADAVAAYGLHGALLIGGRRPVGADPGGWRRRLAAFDAELGRNAVLVDRGHSRNVLGSPVLALRHLVGLLAQDRVNPPLEAGEIVTTGTLTAVLPIAAGESWTCAFGDLGLDPIAIRFN